MCVWQAMKWHFGKGPCIGSVHILYLLGCVREAAHTRETKYPIWEQDAPVCRGRQSLRVCRAIVVLGYLVSEVTEMADSVILCRLDA